MKGNNTLTLEKFKEICQGQTIKYHLGDEDGNEKKYEFTAEEKANIIEKYTVGKVARYKLVIEYNTNEDNIKKILIEGGVKIRNTAEALRARYQE